MKRREFLKRTLGTAVAAVLPGLGLAGAGKPVEDCIDLSMPDPECFTLRLYGPPPSAPIRDIVIMGPGCYKITTGDFASYMKNPIILDRCWHGSVIGAIVNISQGKHGIVAHGCLCGNIRSLPWSSGGIGYIVKESHSPTRSEIVAHPSLRTVERVIDSIEIMEISLSLDA